MYRHSVRYRLCCGACRDDELVYSAMCRVVNRSAASLTCYGRNLASCLSAFIVPSSVLSSSRGWSLMSLSDHVASAAFDGGLRRLARRGSRALNSADMLIRDDFSMGGFVKSQMSPKGWSEYTFNSGTCAYLFAYVLQAYLWAPFVWDFDSFCRAARYGLLSDWICSF